jgi:hypothetical protein
MARTMKRNGSSMMQRLVTFGLMVFLTVTLYGCHDPTETNMAAEHQKLGMICQRQIREAQVMSGEQGISVFTPRSSNEALYPAP